MIRRLRPGWLVALFAVIVSVSTWLPWLTTTVGGGGWANAIGGTHGNLALPPGFGAGQLIALLSSTLLVAGAMVGRGLSAKLSSVVALVVSLLIVALTIWYYTINVNPQVSAEYGLYVGGARPGARWFAPCGRWPPRPCNRLHHSWRTVMIVMPRESDAR
ncbi:putative cONSERVED TRANSMEMBRANE PROTEIN [Mycobacterium kansasii 824]|uniref:Putative cONSERVED TRANSMEMBRANE PROTEIN n=1 Tax=Mycobacterium kansasii TaxID=1768 RepID=A0A1V3X684_MYCKA|nr:putative cONSERVED TRANSMEMBRANE PROTEIN [Mycobacterium kansasii 824]OOK74577.1 putative cONSERVED TRANSMEMBRANE PROTEIN [Mycobacterium kansasii]